MKLKCYCGNVINTTGGFCRGVCKLYNENEYILLIKYFSGAIPMQEYHGGGKMIFFCEECKRYYIFIDDTTYVVKPCLDEKILYDDYEPYHLIDEFEQEEIANIYDDPKKSSDPQKRDEAIESDFKLLHKTRMMNFSSKDKKAYIENLDGSIEAYILEREIKK